MDARVALDITLKKFKLKAAEIAEKAGMNQHELSRYRRGHSDVLASRAFQIIKALPTHAQIHFWMLYLQESDNVQAS
jgi:transcriptional regulator with XRE-family HTH domain